MPFSSRAWPRWTPSSGLPVSPISISQDTNSLGTHRRQRRCDNTHTGAGITQQMYTKSPREVPSLHKGECVWSVEGALNLLLIILIKRDFTTCYEQHLLEIDVTMATNTILAKRNDLFTVGGHICLLNQPAGFSLCVLSGLTLFILDIRCNTNQIRRI